MLKVHVLDAGHGDCILLDFEHTKILVDSGPKKMKIRKAIIPTLEALLGDSRKIDLAIVTHNDDDHIGGYKYLLQTSIKIKKIVFNSLNDIPDIVAISSPQISFKQDNELRKQLIEDKKIAIDTLTIFDSPIVINGIKIEAITPTVEALEEMYRAYDAGEISKGEKELSPTQISAYKKNDVPLGECLVKIEKNEDTFIRDTSKPNKASIAFVVEYRNFRGLFLADAYAEDIVNGIKLKNYEDKSFNVIKLSHHGSEKNTNMDLLRIVGKTEYILCADKSKHNHPNNRTIARILSFDNNPTIHFSAKKQNFISLFTELKDLNKVINATFSTDNLNTIVYEC
ncbi:ComEC/Rec2 family competence protein [Acinetobacter sp. YH12134]|uniref:ComEC/Rec2 family competence protein n=1 Tax=Acinetobacter sp. YH12134 TaxID=2601118 RepID=UPI0015D2B34D|nr:MBL fold metallo-hydrolase [Acinetobacter sp. YH12134]